MSTVCDSETKIWKVNGSVMGCTVSTPDKKEADTNDGVSKPVACVTNDGSKYACYRGKLMIHMYEVVEINQERDSKRLETIDLAKEIQGSGHDDFRFDFREDELMDMRFMGGEVETHLRVYLMVQGQHYFADVDLRDGTVRLREASIFEDMSVLDSGKAGENDEDNPRYQKH